MAFTLKMKKSKDSAYTMFPCPSAFKIGRRKIWSSNAKRTSNGEYKGTVIAVKRDLEIAWPADMKKSAMENLIEFAESKDQDIKIQFTNEVGEEETRHYYLGDLETDIYMFFAGRMLYNSIGIKAVEI